MKYFVEVTNSGTFWCKDAEMKILHREDGPAVEYTDGNKFWLLNGKRHREDGPACEWADGTKAWYLNGIRMTEEEHRKKTQPESAVELTMAEIEKLLGKKIKIVK